MNKAKIKTIICTSSIGLCLLVGTMNYNAYQLHKQLEDKSEQLNQLIDDNKQLKIEFDKLTKESISDKENIIKLEKELKSKTDKLNSMMKNVSYNPYDIGSKSNATTYHLRKAFKGTKMQGLESAFVKAEKDYGVNAIFLAGLVANESGWNDSKRAKDGSNNITGHAVYTDVSRGSYFNSKEECVLSTAKLLKNDYINPKGEHYNGNDIWGINKKYSINKDKSINWKWSEDINSIANDLKNKANK